MNTITDRYHSATISIRCHINKTDLISVLSSP